MQSPEIARLLPGIFQRGMRPGEPLAALVDVMAGLLTPAEGAYEGLAAALDPRRAPDAFVRFLARWVDLDLPLQTGLGQLRELVAAAAELAKWRGTERGLVRFLELATGLRGFRVDQGGAGGRPFHLTVVAPAEAESLKRTVCAIIEREKPVYTTYTLRFEGGT